MANNANLPIDIHYNKLLDWLLSRRHVQAEWHGKATGFRIRKTALSDKMPEEHRAVLENETTTYFELNELVKDLKTTDVGATNMIGQYTNPAMKELWDLITEFQKDNVHLADASQQLTRLVNYEVTGAKKQVQQAQRMQTEGAQKQADYQKNAAEMRRRFKSDCDKLGISGSNIRLELLRLAAGLPAIYERLVARASELRPVVDFHHRFLKELHDLPTEDVLPTMQFLFDHGNVTVYQWRTGVVPERVVEPSIVEEESEHADVDWGTGGDAEINWDDEINFGITIEDSADQDLMQRQNSEGYIAVDKVEHIAEGVDARTILDHAESRDLFLNDLYQLEAFLTQRIAEQTSDKYTMLASIIQESVSREVQLTTEDLQRHLDAVVSLIGAFTEDTFCHLTLVRSAPNYVSRLVTKLSGFSDQAAKYIQLNELSILRVAEAVEQEKIARENHGKLGVRAMKLKKLMEAAVSAKYDNRPVNIMGEINSVHQL